MTQPSSTPELPDSETIVISDTDESELQTLASSQPQPSYVKLAMRNMVRKRGTSLYHFALTTIGLLAVLVGLAYVTH